MAKKERVRGAFVRTCAGCGGKIDKREHGFIRIANIGGEISVGKAEKSEGRGAYVCANKDCVAKLKKSGRLPKLLRSSVPAHIYDLAEEAVDG